MNDVNIKSNQPTLSVSEISQAVKRTVEDSFSYVRVRGELSGSKKAASGHVYFSLKDENAVLSGICWKGVASRLPFDVEDGLEVICTGKITTYPGRSNYQIVVDSMVIAGEGALMALLEKRKKQFAKEGLFDESRKQALPFIPQVIGVITSPTGAVIRDILHRISDRFPVHVIVWPVLVQGNDAKNQIAEAIEGFNNLSEHDDVAKPDLLIVARGGGSLEDLWAFNEEIVVRAAAASKIPLISAVGHETDTTLIDYVSDKRAPTPTAAAEIAVPVREEWLLSLMDSQKRLYSGITRLLTERNSFVKALGAGLLHPKQMIENATQRLDDWTERLLVSFPAMLETKRNKLHVLASKLTSPMQLLATMSERLAGWAGRLKPHTILRSIEMLEQKLHTQAQLLESYHYKKVLARGFALVRDGAGDLITSSGIADGTALDIEFSDGVQKAVAGSGSGVAKSKATNKKVKADSGDQGDLF